MNDYDWNNHDPLKDELPTEEPLGSETNFRAQAPAAEPPLAQPDGVYREPVGEQPSANTANTAERSIYRTVPFYHNDFRAADPAGGEQPVRQAPPVYQPQSAPAAKPTRRQGRSGGFWGRAVALVLCCVLLAAAAGFGGGYLATRVKGSQSAGADGEATMLVANRETTPVNTVRTDTGKLLTASEVYAQNVNSTVGITTEVTTTNYWGFQSTGAAAGSGFILTDNGYILTNYHVIESANSITVAMYDGKEYPASLVGYDASNDIAVLKIEASGLTPVVLGNSDDLVVGQDVVAIGNPLGELTFSLTRGAVSALDRTVSLSNNVTMDLIQTDCAINAGNSGGALFNLYGEVVGITNAKYSSSGLGEASIDNIGFAIPINTVRGIVTSIIEKGYISKPYIGVSVSNVGSESLSYGMPEGAAIRSVEPGSPAEAAGLQPNDIVTAVDGKTITAYTGLSEAVSASEIGDKLELTVYRRGETLSITVVVGENVQSANEAANQNGQSDQSGSQSGNGSFPWGWGYGG